jgi:hypothetical protein
VKEGFDIKYVLKEEDTPTYIPPGGRLEGEPPVPAPFFKPSDILIFVGLVVLMAAAMILMPMILVPLMRR